MGRPEQANMSKTDIQHPEIHLIMKKINIFTQNYTYHRYAITPIDLGK